MGKFGNKYTEDNTIKHGGPVLAEIAKPQDGQVSQSEESAPPKIAPEKKPVMKSKAPPKTTATAPATPEPEPAPKEEVSPTRGVMVQFTSRCELDAERQFKAIAPELGKTQQALLAEALNLLFKKYGKGEVA